ESAPWNLVKDEKQTQTLNAVLYRAAETLRWLVVLLSPVMPAACDSIWKQIGLAGSPSDTDPNQLEWGGLEAGTTIGDTEPVFPRLDSSKIMEEINSANEIVEAEEQEFITIDDFIKVELRVGEVLEAENVPKSDKLLRCLVDVGDEHPRQILAGIAEHYRPEELVGKKIVVVYNLKPRMMMGLESQGMICAASLGKNDKPVVATFDEEVPNGARLT
ncbi:MAG: methionine--tRNA ligase subunit beta, partial [Acidobacteriota bacterium]|nr:methionine--tRNA ligase subunit beta [Acidobacteriota bacterium]